MSGVTPTVDNTYGAVNVLVDATVIAGGALLTMPSQVILSRVLIDGTSTIVRGSPVTLSGGQALFWDDEAPLQTAVSYSASIPAGIQVLYDVFSRSVTGTWGNATSGQTYTNVNGTQGVNGTSGTQTHSATNVLESAQIDVGTTDVHFTVDVTCPIGTPLGAPITHWICFRLADLNNYYVVRLDIATNGSVNLAIVKRVGGTLSGSLISNTIATTHNINDTYRVEVIAQGMNLSTRAWMPTTQAPPSFLTTSDGDLTTGTQLGFMTRFESGNTNTLPQTFLWDNLTVNDLKQNLLTGGPVTIIGSGGDIAWLKDPVMPTNDVPISLAASAHDCVSSTGQVSFVSLSDETFVNASGQFSIINDPRGANISMLRKAATMTLVITSHELSDIPKLEAIFASGRNLLLQIPTKYGWALASFGTDYVQVSDVTKGRIGLADLSHPERVWTVPLALGRVPTSPTGLLGSNGIGVGRATWGQMAASGKTWLQLWATSATYLQLSQGQGY